MGGGALLSDFTNAFKLIGGGWRSPRQSENKGDCIYKVCGVHDEEEKWTLKEVYKMTKIEGKLAVMTAKAVSLKRLYVELGDKVGEKKLYRFTKAKDRKACTWIK
ncbi:hypothetical protein H5410_036754 [Solanum commersonii]|uniref:Uncharacterized protein n=1 Tax=Solanum commersonii TaxID=4109 RepID=A0A9J5Y656_SOLCO|nr:hypothetical protein H5410_036754 [Solanum commersonii]